MKVEENINFLVDAQLTPIREHCIEFSPITEMAVEITCRLSIGSIAC